MERDLYNKLLQWKASPRRKPLVLRGARQVGKTYLLKLFGKNEYQNIAYVNFEFSPQIKSFFENELKPQWIIEQISIFLDLRINATTTLIFFDEIQECSKALNSLKYFNELANEFHVVTAGSLLGVKLAHGTSFPVGKVNFLDLYPLSFFEFLTAVSKNNLRHLLESNIRIEPLASAFHEELIVWLKRYIYLGGMPEVIADYLRTQDYGNARIIQNEILTAYSQDFSKHAEVNQVLKISDIWSSLPGQLAKENRKFQFASLNKSARAREYDTALQWLIDAKLICPVYNLSSIKLPLKAYTERNVFSLFALDVGLLGAQSNLTAKILIDGEALFTEFKGALTENLVAQQLMIITGGGLFFWKSQHEAQVDFIIEQENKVYPLEVKAGIATKSKSIKVYDKKFNPSLLLRTSLLNLKQDGKLLNIPLYMINMLPALISSSLLTQKSLDD